MDKITSIQGKEFNYSDVLLLKRDGNRIIVMLNDEEQLKKFSNKEGDAPVAVVAYTEETYSKLVSQMKQIKSYPKDEFGVLNVEYVDGTKTNFSNGNKEIIENNYVEQQRVKAIASDWTKGLESNYGIQNQPINMTGINIASPDFNNSSNKDGLDSKNNENMEMDSSKRHKIEKIQKYEDTIKKGASGIALSQTINMVSLAVIIALTSIVTPLSLEWLNVIQGTAGGLFILSNVELINSIAEKVALKLRIDELKEEVGIVDEDKKRGGK